MYNMDATRLLSAGLSLSEAEVYLCLLEKGPCLASSIASSTSISRPHVYGALNNLIKKGMAGYVVRENRRYFRAAEPEKFLSLMQEKEKKLGDEKNYLQSIVPELKAIRVREEEPVIEIFRGVEGLKTVMEDVLQNTKIQLTIGYTGKTSELSPIWWEKWQTRRIENKIKRRIITTEDMRRHFDIVRPLTEARFIPAPFTMPTSIILYGKDKLIFFVPFEKDFIGIRIKSSKIRTSYDTYFSLLWRIASK